MINIETAYKIANDFFRQNEYLGVNEAREADANWMFSGKLEGAMYGVSEVCVPKNGDEPYLIDICHEPYTEMWEKANSINVAELAKMVI